MIQKRINAEIILTFVDDLNLTDKQYTKLMLDVETLLNSLPSQVLDQDFYTGFCGTRFHFKDEIKPLNRGNDNEENSS